MNTNTRLPIQFTARAERHILRAAQYFGEVMANGTGRFRDEIEAALLRIQDFPESYLEYRPGIRRCLLRGFDYAICYRVLPDKLYVIGVPYLRSHPDNWLRRR